MQQYLGDNANMFIVRAPLRISLFGGGTDLPEFYEKHGSTIVSFALDKYIYVIFNRRFTGGWRISYSTTEEVDDYDQIRHTLVRAAYEKYQPFPCTLTMIGDMPKETGLGSSSALAVALIQALDFKLNIAGSRRGLAEKAFKLERGTGAPVGKQDHYAAAFGGFRVYHFGDWAGHPAQTIPDGARILRELQGWALLLYTGRTRSAAAILSEQSRRGDMGALTEIMYIAAEAQSLLMQHTDAATPIAIGSLLHHAWFAKRRVVEGITDDTLDAQYTAARDAGAIGGKLLGAGGGGCWFFVVPPDARPHVQNALGLPVIPWSPDWDGCKAVLGHGAFVRKGPR